MVEFKLPDLGEGIHEGEILKWHVTEGGAIEEDAPLVDVETDKAAVTIPSPSGGTVKTILAKEGQTVYVGDVIVVIDTGEGAAADAPADAPAKPKDAPAKPAKPTTSPAPEKRDAESKRERVAAAPATRRRAREASVDINAILGTGPGGRVTNEDVERAAEGGAAASSAESMKSGAETPAVRRKESEGGSNIPLLDLDPLPDFEALGPITKEPLRSIRRKVARRMVSSAILAPRVAHMDDADVTAIEDLRGRLRVRYEDHPGGRFTLLPFVIKAITAGLKEFPALNASVDPYNEEIIYKHYYNVGFAADTPRGLVVPVVRGADTMTLLDLSADIVDRAIRAREGELSVEDLTGGTFTVTNIGPLGGTYMLPIINPPEVAILGMGRVSERPVVRDGEIVIRKILPLSLAFDHRLIDGGDAARFMNALIARIEDPERMLVET